MVYDIQWLKNEHVLQVVFRGDFSQDDICNLVDDLYTELSSAQQTVHIVVDVPSGCAYPRSLTSLIPVATQYYGMPNLGYTMLVTDNMGLWTFAKLVSQASTKNHRFVTARTLYAVLDYLAEKDDRLTPAFAEARAG
jgi:hypothetical protein